MFKRLVQLFPLFVYFFFNSDGYLHYVKKKKFPTFSTIILLIFLLWYKDGIWGRTSNGVFFFREGRYDVRSLNDV